LASTADLAIILKAKDDASRVLHKVGGPGGALPVLGLAAAAAGAAMAGALVAGFASSISAAQKFEKEISAVKAVTGATALEAKQLSDVALQLGKDTSFSASEAAAGIGELAKGGVSVADIMGGAAAAALNLAAAGGVEVAEAAALAANAMALFNIEGKDMGGVVDKIAGFANATTGTVSDFKFALQMSGAAAKLAGQDFGQTATAIALLGKAGVLGSDAGTSLKTMLLNLQPETKRQIDLFKQLGLATNEVHNNFLNADGSFKDLRDIAAELNRAVGDLSESERTMALSTIFGSDAIRAAAILAEAGAEGFDAMAAAMDKVSAAAVAKERLDNLAGSMEQLSGSVETAQIQLGMYFTPILKEAADAATAFTNESIIPFIETHGPAWAERVREMGQALKDFKEDPLAGVKQELPETTRLFQRLAESGVGELIGRLAVLGGEGVGSVKFSIEPFRPLTTALENGAKSLNQIGDAISNVSSLAEELRKNAAGLGQAVIDGIVNGLSPERIKTKMLEIANALPQWVRDALGIHSASAVFRDQVGKPIIEGIIAGIEGQIPALVTTVKTIPPELVAAARDIAVSGGNELGSAFDEGIVAAILNNEPAVAGVVAAAMGRLAATAAAAWGTGIGRDWSQTGGPPTQQGTGGQQSYLDAAIAAGQTWNFNGVQVPYGAAGPYDYLGRLLPSVSFAGGGIVPGPRGAAMMAMVHGGERVVPAGQGSGPTYVFNGDVYGDEGFFERIQQGYVEGRMPRLVSGR